MKMETALYKAMVASNVSEQNATALVEAWERDVTSVLANKTDLAEVRNELKAEIAEVRNDLKAEIAGVRNDLKAEITTVRSELKADIAQVRAELKTEITKVATDLKTVELSLLKEIANLNTTLTVRMVVVMTALQGIAGSLLFAALRFFK